MCGVAALYAYEDDAVPVAAVELDPIRAAMRHRGPDGQGTWLSQDGRVGLAHTRLSILDPTPRAAQPMTDDDNARVISFNGEIYNFRELRADLEKKGYGFRSTGDTEVLLKLYREYGTQMLALLRGMFAFALWDEKRQRLFCARDPYGIKPLYYADASGKLLVASEVRALRAAGAGAALDSAAVAGFCLFGHVPEPFTLYREVRALPAGSCLQVERGGPIRLWHYHCLAEEWRAQGREPQTDQLADALRESVAAHLIADVPVGLFLSSGIDSTAILGLAPQQRAPDIQAVTLRFAEFRDSADDEGPLAADAARLFGAQHVAVEIRQDEVRDWLPRFLADMDQPTIDGLNTWLVSKCTADLGLKVALSGVGGDELFGGYPSFSDLPKWVRAGRRLGLIPGLSGVARRGLSLGRLLGAPISPKAEGLATLTHTWPGAYLVRRGLFMPWELASLLGEELAADGLERLAPLDLVAAQLEPDPGYDFGRVATLEASLYMRNQLLRDADWAGMGHSVEIRTPWVDSRLLSRAAPILKADAALRSKQVLVDATRPPLPDSISSRAKTGFSVPIGSWLENLPDLDVWKRVPLLRSHGCHWARRWAYTIMAPKLNEAA